MTGFFRPPPLFSGTGTVVSNTAIVLADVIIAVVIADPSGYNHREALFGKIPYGNALSQTVYWADAELCDDFVDRQKGYPCRYDATGKCAPWGWMGGDVGEVPYILMVDRGSCSFVRKVQNAQKAGAAAVSSDTFNMN